MILSEEDIYNRVESYRNFKGLNQDEMANLMGVSNKQAYSKMMKNRTMKLIYFINLINNTGEDSIRFLKEKSTYDIHSYKLGEVNEPSMLTYICPNCIEKQKVIDQLRNELQIFKDKYIVLLENVKIKKPVSNGS